MLFRAGLLDLRNSLLNALRGGGTSAGGLLCSKMVDSRFPADDRIFLRGRCIGGRCAGLAREALKACGWSLLSAILVQFLRYQSLQARPSTFQTSNSIDFASG